MSKLRSSKTVKHAGVFTALLMSALGLLASVAPIAHAFNAYGKPPYDAGGYTAWRSYFKDYAPVGVAGYDVLPRQAVYGDNSMPVITDPSSFVNFMRDNYNEAINSDTQDDGSFNFGWRKTGSAFIGWTMLGVSPGNMGPSGTPGSRETSPDWNDLLNRLNALNAAGKISWNVPVSTANYGGVNTRYLGAPYDDVQAVTLPSSVGNGIIFHDYNDNVAYVIRYNCANPLGAFPGVPQKPAPSWSLSANATADSPSVWPGQAETFRYNLHNNGPDPANFQYVTRVQEYIGGVAQPIGTAGPNGAGSWPVPNAYEGSLPGGWSEPSYSVRTYVPGYTPGLTKACSWIEYAGQSSSNGNPASSNQVCITVNQPVASCSAFNLIPGSIEPGMQYNTYASVNYGVQPGAAAAYGSGGRLFVRITGPNGYVADATIDYGPPAAADISGNSPLFPAATAGTYTVTYGIRGGAIGNANCSASFSVAYHPYFSVTGGDVSAGNGFDWAGACAGNDSASIKSWNLIDNAPNNYGGGNSALGAFVTATNGLQHFVSGSSLTGGAASNTGHGLSFANYSGAYVAAPNFGTSIGPSSSLPCVHDYQADDTSSTTLPLSGTILTSGTLSGLAAGNYDANPANVTIGDGAPITMTSGRKVTIYVKGDVYIRNNITYSYNQISDIPMLRIVVKGGIYIDPSVTEIHGVFIAQAKGASGPQHAMGGIFATCATGPGSTTTKYSVCNNKLTVVGAVAAENQVILGRSYGSLLAEPAHGVPADSAETFQYSPELWLNPANGPAQGALTYQAFTSLPPVL